jgi:hypothetical protein
MLLNSRRLDPSVYDALSKLKADFAPYEDGNLWSRIGDYIINLSPCHPNALMS